jgi:hypothetical protein
MPLKMDGRYFPESFRYQDTLYPGHLTAMNAITYDHYRVNWGKGGKSVADLFATPQKPQPQNPG